MLRHGSAFRLVTGPVFKTVVRDRKASRAGSIPVRYRLHSLNLVQLFCETSCATDNKATVGTGSNEGFWHRWPPCHWHGLPWRSVPGGLAPRLDPSALSW
jgi:hypothetical protein